MYLNIRIVASFRRSSAYLQLQHTRRHVQARHITSRAKRIQPTAPAREGAGHQFQTQMIAAVQTRSLRRPAALLAPQALCTINSFLMECCCALIILHHGHRAEAALSRRDSMEPS